MAVDGERRVWLVTFEHQLHCTSRRFERRVRQGALEEGGSESGGVKQAVTFAQWNRQLPGETQDHLPTGRGPAGLEKTASDARSGDARPQTDVTPKTDG